MFSKAHIHKEKNDKICWNSSISIKMQRTATIWHRVVTSNNDRTYTSVEREEHSHGDHLCSMYWWAFQGRTLSPFCPRLWSLLLLLLLLLAHQHKAADIRYWRKYKQLRRPVTQWVKYFGRRLYSLSGESRTSAAGTICCFLSVFSDHGDAPAYFLSQLVPRAGRLGGSGVE